MKKRILSLFTILLLINTSLNATIHYVKSISTGTGNGSSWANASNDLQAMIDASAVNDTIWIAEGTFKPDFATPNDQTSTFGIATKGLKIFGSFVGTETSLTQRNINAHLTILSGDIGIINDSTDNVYTVVTISEDSILLNGLYITKGNEQYYGFNHAGGITINGTGSSTNVTNIDSCYIYSNYGIEAGGIAVYGKAYITNSNIYNNNTNYNSGSGGGINVDNSGYLLLNKCLIKNNFSGSKGGGIFTATGIISNCIIENNKSFLANGGGVYLANGNLNLINDTIRNNTAAPYYDGKGGGFYNEMGNATITNCVIYSNSSGGNGGGIAGSYGAQPTDIINCKIYNNNAKIGGGLYFERPFTLTDCNIYNNTAEISGGGLDAENSADHTLLRDTFYNNHAVEYGGALYNGGTCTAINCRFYNNDAKGGGAIYNYNSYGMFLKQSVFNNNTAVQFGGGAIFSFYSPDNISNNLFYNNTAVNNYGGAIFISNYTTIPISNNTFFGNNVSSNNISYKGGGAIAFSQYGQADISNNVFAKNTINNNKDTIGSDVVFDNSTTIDFKNNLLQLDSLSYENGATITQLQNIYRKHPSFVDNTDIDGPDNRIATSDDGLRLQACSPAVNTGLSNSNPDLLNNTRVGNTDMGAYEYQSGVQNASLANSNVTIIDNQIFTTYYGFCGNEVANVLSTGNNPIGGITTTKVWIESTQPIQFVKRHYEITPTSNATTATGKVTLYFTQADFDDFNAVNAFKLPTGSADAAGISNLLIEKRSGVSGDGTGLPNTYNGSIITINPADGDIIWNATANRWEVSFDVTGFSGFFVKTESGILPIRLIHFTATKQPNENVLLQWLTANEINANHFVVESSINGNSFQAIGTLAAQNTVGNINYHLIDNSVWNSAVRYYRLKSIDNNGSFTYSAIIRVNNKQQSSISLYPNPVKDVFNIQLTDAKLLHTQAKLLDATSKTILLLTINSLSQTVNAVHLPAGIYMLHFTDGTSVKIIKQ